MMGDAKVCQDYLWTPREIRDGTSSHFCGRCGHPWGAHREAPSNGGEAPSADKSAADPPAAVIARDAELGVIREGIENEVWDEVVRVCQQAWPGKRRMYMQSPTELIVEIINERDEALNRAVVRGGTKPLMERFWEIFTEVKRRNLLAVECGSANRELYHLCVDAVRELCDAVEAERRAAPEGARSVSPPSPEERAVGPDDIVFEGHCKPNGFAAGQLAQMMGADLREKVEALTAQGWRHGKTTLRLYCTMQKPAALERARREGKGS